MDSTDWAMVALNVALACFGAIAIIMLVRRVVASMRLRNDWSEHQDLIREMQTRPVEIGEYVAIIDSQGDLRIRPKMMGQVVAIHNGRDYEIQVPIGLGALHRITRTREGFLAP